MLTILIGKTCSGKDSIVKRLCKDYGMKKIVTYTTRPMRKGEIQDVTYHYIPEEEFKEKINSNFFLEYKVYNTADGQWFYGSSTEDIVNADNNSVIILTPQGYKDIKSQLVNKDCIALYIYANNNTIRQRLIKRGDKKDEAERRILADNEDFKDIMKDVDRIIYNNTGTNINDVVDTVYKYSKGEK